MTPTLLGELMKYGDTKVTIASNILKDAETLAAMCPDFSAEFLDVKNTESMEELIGRHDHVISFIPPWMHTPIA